MTSHFVSLILIVHHSSYSTRSIDHTHPEHWAKPTVHVHTHEMVVSANTEKLMSTFAYIIALLKVSNVAYPDGRDCG